MGRYTRADSYLLYTVHQNCTVKGPWDTRQMLRLSYVSVLWRTVFNGSETLPVIRHDVEHESMTALIRCLDSALTRAHEKHVRACGFRPHLHRPNRVLLFEWTFLGFVEHAYTYHQFSTSRNFCPSRAWNTPPHQVRKGSCAPYSDIAANPCSNFNSSHWFDGSCLPRSPEP